MTQRNITLLVLLVMMMSFVRLVELQGTSNRKLVVTSIIQPPYLMHKINKESLTGNDVYEGFIIDLLDELTRRIGFQYELSLETTFGAKTANGRWNGMVGELVEGRADLSLAPLTETSERARVVDFGNHFQTFGRVAIVKQFPRKTVTRITISLDVRLGRLFAPLADSVWLLSGLAWFVASLVLYIICRINPFEWRRMTKDHEATLREGESFNCANSYWFMLGAIFWQGFMRSPRSMGARIVVTFWWLYALIFVSMYIASLTNYLQSIPQSNKVVESHSRIRSMGDILDDYNVKVGAIESSATKHFLENSEVELYTKLSKRLSKDNLYVKTLMEGIKRVRNSTREDPYVFFSESTLVEHFIKQPPCDLYMIRDFPFTGSYAPAYPIGSDLKTAMNLALYEIKEAGELSRLEQKWFSGECKGNYLEVPDEQTKDVQYPPFQRVDLASFSGALILLMIGLTVGAIVTVIEILIFKYYGNDQQESKQDKHLMTEKPQPSTKSGQHLSDV